MTFPDRTTSKTFVSSVQALYTQLGGFDGIDWDSFEGATPDTTEIIWMSQQLKSIYPGFMITVPPAPWNDVDMTFCSEMASADALDYCAPQYYDGPGLAEQSRGAFDWQIDIDYSMGWPFATQVGPLVNP